MKLKELIEEKGWTVDEFDKTVEELYSKGFKKGNFKNLTLLMFVNSLLDPERTVYDDFDNGFCFVINSNNKLEKRTTYKFGEKKVNCGDVVKISIDGKNWTETSIEHNGKRYYATINPLLELQGLFCREVK